MYKNIEKIKAIFEFIELFKSITFLYYFLEIYISIFNIFLLYLFIDKVYKININKVTFLEEL